MAVPAISDLVKPSRYAWLQIMSILLPGVLILVEVWVALAAPEPLLTTADDATRGLSTTTTLFAALVALASAYVVGTAARELFFALLLPREHRCERLPRFAPSPRDALENLKREYPSKAESTGDNMPGPVDLFLACHPRLVDVLQSNDRIGVLAYTKTWLREHRPTLSVDDIGVEINIVVGLVLPVFLAPIAVLRWAQANAVVPELPLQLWWLVAAGAATLLTDLTARRVATLARYELEDALRNLALAHWVSERVDHPRRRLCEQPE